MRRHVVFASLLLLGAGLLAGCGQKGPLFLPPARPAAPAPATSAQPAPAASPRPAPATTLPSPGASAASPAAASSG